MNAFTRFILSIEQRCKVEQEYRRDVLSMFEPAPNAKLLDLGCNNGEFTLEVANIIGTRQVSGVEVVMESIEQARARGIECYQASLEDAKLPIEDGSFDVVCGNQVIEHIANTDGFVREIHRILRPGGYAIISTPNLASWACIIFLVLGWQPFPAPVSDDFPWAGTLNTQREGAMAGVMPGHKHVFTFKALREFLQCHGFRVERSKGTGLRPLPASLARMLVRFNTGRADIITVKVVKS
jgi:methionine biosynthesis protein MetW